MEKVYGTEERHDSLIIHGTGRAILIYGYGEENGMGYDYRRHFQSVPTEAEVTDILTNHINALTDKAILSGFRWRGIPVWLSSENQFNFKAAYDVAVQTQGASLPVKFKLGEDGDGNPVYHTFSDMAEFTDFHTSAIAYIIGCLNAGWAEKDAARTWVEGLGLPGNEPK